MEHFYLDYLLSHEGKSCFLTGYSILECRGSDVERFLNGQLTNDVSQLGLNTFQQQTRLNRTGQVQAFFYLLKDDKCFYMACLQELLLSLVEDLNKFIIMDDVELVESDKKLMIQLAPTSEKKSNFFNGCWAHLPVSMILTREEEGGDLKEKDLETLALLGGEPVWGQTIVKGQLATDSLAMLAAVSLQKGCFLGQETVAKIESRRGGAYFPVVLTGYRNERGKELFVGGKKIGKAISSMEFNNRSITVASLIRNYRVVGKDIHFDDGGQGLVSYLPLWNFDDPRAYAKAILEHAIIFFQNGDDDKAITLLERALCYQDDYADAYEALGVILGRHERYEEAIALMDKLAAADPNSVMAHTNKSLYLMKLGKIEEAEEEKAQATVKSFASFGREAQDKKALEEQEKAEQLEIERRESMFRQVLEIDPHDTLANFGLADIEYKKKNYQVSRDLLGKVLNADAKYSVGYTLLGKVLMSLGEHEEAQEILSKGIEVASANGDLMPANEMQELLNKINQTS